MLTVSAYCASKQRFVGMLRTYVSHIHVNVERLKRVHFTTEHRREINILQMRIHILKQHCLDLLEFVCDFFLVLFFFDVVVLVFFFGK